VKTLIVGIKVVVRDGEPVRRALARLDRMVVRAEGRPSHKRRFGYYEKPSELRRKRFKKEAVRPGYPLHVSPHAALFARTGPTSALMR
jgi:ribosomal protein S21